MCDLRYPDWAFRSHPTENPELQASGVVWAHLLQPLRLATGLPCPRTAKPDIGGCRDTSGMRELLLH